MGPINNLEDAFGNIYNSVHFINSSDIDAKNLNSIGICAICGAKGSGYHYNVYSCEGWSFF